MRMQYYIGIDGGGSKTSVAIGNGKGQILDTILYEGCSYQEIGIKAVVHLISSAVDQILRKTGVEKKDCVACCIGLPCFGENERKDEVINQKIQEKLLPIAVYIVNDGIVGWAGSLNCNAGIHLVAGTGSIAVGFDTFGNFSRCGGWNEIFGDEGSCYWIGKKIMQLFSKEADGRIPKSPIYQMICENYHLRNDYEFIELMTQEVLPYRYKVAELQKIALQAAEKNDIQVKAIYEEATDELSQLVRGVKEKLIWNEKKVLVSYYGGLFHAEKYIIPKLKQELENMNCSLQRPLYTATEGAVRLAIKKYQEGLYEQNNFFRSR